MAITPAEGPAPLTVTLDGSHSFDGNNQDRITSYRFDFGDGIAPVTQSNPIISHLYGTPGSYAPSLTVTDSAGAQSAPAVGQIKVDPPADGSYGLFVVPSNAMNTAPVTVTNIPVSVLTVTEQETLDGTGNVRGLTPYGLIYATTAHSSTNHLYALSLDATKPPAPLQLSSAAFSELCGTYDFLATRNQASSEVLLYTVAGGNGTCGAPTDSTFVVHYGDPSSSAPTPSALNALAVENFNLFEVRNGDGTLAGLGSVDGSGNLSFSSDLSYSRPSVLLSQVSAVQPQYDAGGFSFITVTPPSGPSVLYRVDSSGKLSGPLYQYRGNPSFEFGVANGAFLYFTDSSTSFSQSTLSTSYSLAVVKVPLDGSSTGQVVASTSGTYNGGSSSSGDVYVDDFIGSTAIVVDNANANVGESFLYTLDTATTGAPLKAILTLPDTMLDFIVPVADGRIFASYSSAAYTTDVLNLDGSLVTRFANTDLVGANYAYSGTPSNIRSTVTAVYLAQGISTAPGTPSDSGATLQKLAPDTLASTPVTDAATGKPYVLNNGQFFIELYTAGIPANGSTDFVKTSNTSQQSDALGFDAVNNVLYRFTNTPNINEESVFY